ncbi:F-box only protein 28-like, partial [Stegodyphus dumicola]|uniref:F-box only protein 28-like n=1 Tax=Stegodyphus dumicola TaxID=202533 RepID=UPI0015ADA21E
MIVKMMNRVLPRCAGSIYSTVQQQVAPVICAVFPFAVVCRRFNNLAKGVLNRGYFKARTYIIKCMEEIKDQLPRRESQRSKHRLYKKHNILSGIEPRFNHLGMTYLKFIEGNYTCFIPGKVLDELFKVIRHVMNEPYIVDCSQLTQELRDLIIMAIEDFDENIYPYLKYKYDPAHTQANDFFSDGTHRSREFKLYLYGYNLKSHVQ